MPETEYAGFEFSWDTDGASIRAVGGTTTIYGGSSSTSSSSDSGDVFVLGNDVQIWSNNLDLLAFRDVVISFYDDLTITRGRFWIKNWLSSTITDVDGYGIWQFRNSVGAVKARLEPSDYLGDALLELGNNIGAIPGEEGNGNHARGKVLIHAEEYVNAAGAPTGTGRPGIVILEAGDGSQIFLWAARNGSTLELRAGTTDPGDDPAPLGSQLVVKL